MEKRRLLRGRQKILLQESFLIMKETTVFAMSAPIYIDLWAASWILDQKSNLLSKEVINIAARWSSLFRHNTK